MAYFHTEPVKTLSQSEIISNLELIQKHMKLASSYGFNGTFNGTIFEMALKVDQSTALQDLVRASMKLKEFELHSDKCWKRVQHLEEEGWSNYEFSRMSVLKDAYEASKAVNEFWDKLQMNGMSDYIPEP